MIPPSPAAVEATPLPYLSRELPAIRGVYKARWEDFEVEEVPGPLPADPGEHTWLEIRKSGLTTARAVAEVARALGVRPSSVGRSGLKDARAVARQWLSVERVDPERAIALENPRIRVLRAIRSRRKLRRGWHRGNRFVIRLRPEGTAVGGGPAALPPPDAAAARVILELLCRRGVPNYYGSQRFGTRGDTWLVGRALAREEWMEAAALIAGRPLPPSDPATDAAAGVHPDRDDVLRARRLFDAGAYREAADAWPRGYGQCARLSAAMAETADPRRSIARIGKGMLRLYASAYQSWLFNRVLAVRMPAIDRIMAGDLAWKHETEALFPVEDATAEQPRAAAFEISATGPLVGRRMRAPTGEVAALERETLQRAGLAPAELDSAAMRPLTGRRRPLRFALADAAVEPGEDPLGPYLELRFTLPPGCYATAILRELGRGGIVEGAGTAGEAGA